MTSCSREALSCAKGRTVCYNVWRTLRERRCLGQHGGPLGLNHGITQQLDFLDEVSLDCEVALRAEKLASRNWSRDKHIVTPDDMDSITPRPDQAPKGKGSSRATPRAASPRPRPGGEAHEKIAKPKYEAVNV